jgi:PAS domain-containing protein
MSDPSLQANTTTDEIAELQRRLAELENQLAVSRQAHHVVTDMVDRIDDTFFAVDREWRYLYVNPAAARVACMNPADLLGKTMWETFPQLLGSIH